MATANKPRGNFYCIPKRSKVGASAKATLNQAANTARQLRARNKAYQQKIQVKSIPPLVAKAYTFATSSSGNFHSFTPPFAQVDLTKLDHSFVRAQGALGSADPAFIREMSGKATLAVHAVIASANGILYSAKVRNASIHTKYRYPYAQAPSVRVSLPDGIWLALRVVVQGQRKVVLIRASSTARNSSAASTIVNAVATAQKITYTNMIEIDASLFDGTEVSVFVCPENNVTDAGKAGKNAYKYFDYKGQGVPAPVSAATVNVPAGLVTAVAFNASVNPVEGYGPEFKATRPPGTLANFNLAYVSDTQNAAKVLSFVNDLILQDVATLNSDPAVNITPEHCKIPSGLLDSTSAKVMFNVAALKSTIYEVPPIAYDRRGDANRRANVRNVSPPAGTLVTDPGPFGQARGVDASGAPLIKSAVRPQGKRYDDRVGAMASVYREETTSQNLLSPPSVVAGSKLLTAHSDLKAFLANNSLEAFDLLKILSIAIFRLRAISEEKYKPYVDVCTIAMMFNIDLGVNLLGAYVNDPARVTEALIPSNFNAYMPPVALQSWSSWGSVQVRDVMPKFGYHVVADLPAWDANNTQIASAELFLPQAAPSDATKIQAYGLSYDGPQGVTFKNWSTQGVEHFGSNNTAKRRQPVSLIVLHWGASANGWQNNRGYIPRSLLSTGKSTHFIVGHDGEITQHADLGRVAWHARPYNSFAIGIDTCSPGFPYRSHGFSAANKQGFANKGYTIAACPIFSREGGVYVAPMHVYENLFNLVESLLSIQLNGRVEFPAGPSRFPGLFRDGSGDWGVYAAGGLLVRNFNVPVADPVGVVPHMYTNPTRADDIVAYTYCCLRSLGDSHADAYRRLVLTLEAPVKQTRHEGKSLRYLVLNRS